MGIFFAIQSFICVKGVNVDMKIVAFNQLPNEINDKMEDGLEEYALSHAINVDYKPFSLVLYDEKEEVVGALDAFSSYSSVHIRDLWVKKSHRGKGLGKQLLAELENHFKEKGFHNINTVSCAFQAPEFYVKCGYEVEFVRENIQNPKLTMTFLIKRLEN